MVETLIAITDNSGDIDTTGLTKDLTKRIKELALRDNESFDVADDVLYNIKQNILKLNLLYNTLNQQGLLLKAQMSTSNKQKSFSRQIGANINVSLSAQINGKQELIIGRTQQSINQIITEMYFLTEQILSELGYIKKIFYNVAFVGSTGNIYQTQYGEQFIYEHAALEQRGNELVLKLRTTLSQFTEFERGQKSELKKSENSKEYKEFQKLIKNFFKPGVNKTKFYSVVEKENKRTGKIIQYKFPKYYNEGAVYEAYLRLKENNISFNSSTINDQINYYLDSFYGNDPYYTGPDINKEQVKIQNATIASVNTILNTAYGILYLFKTTGDPAQLKENIVEATRQDNGPVDRSIRQNLDSGIKKELRDYIYRTIRKLNNKS